MITLTDESRQLIAMFDEQTTVTPTDCLVDEPYDRIVFVIPVGEMATAIGPGGQVVRRVEARVSHQIELVEAADRADAFVANALTPAAVYNVTVSEGESTVAYAEVATEDRGVAIGTDGRTIERARALAARHFEIDDVQLT
jgi:N utilization substance protein A